MSKSTISPVPYNGSESYLFVSYAHRDKNLVYLIISRMNEMGLRVWFDEGIDPGTEWDENIAMHVCACDSLIAFISSNYLESDNCRDELNYARDLKKGILLIYLQDVQLPVGMAMRMNRLQAIHWYRLTRKEDFIAKLLRCEFVARNRNEHHDDVKLGKTGLSDSDDRSGSEPSCSKEKDQPEYLIEGYCITDGRILDSHGCMIPDAPYIVLNLSVRAFNVFTREQDNLRQEGHSQLMVSDILRLNPERLVCLRNLGARSVPEVVREVQNYLRSPEKYIAQAETKKKESVFAVGYEVVNGVIRDRKTGDIVCDAPLQKLGIKPLILKCIVDGGYKKISELIGVSHDYFRSRANVGKRTVEEVSEKLTSYLLLNRVNYGQDADADVIVTPLQIMEFLGEHEFRGVTFDEMMSRFPGAEYSLISKLLNQLISDGLIEREGTLIRKTHVSFFHYAFTTAKDEKKKLNDSHLEVIRWRSLGNSLEEVGRMKNMTRERVRQIEQKAFAILTNHFTDLFLEDAWADIYQTYAIEKDMFIIGMGQSIQTWYYLSYRYERGNKTPYEILEDVSVPVSDRYALEQYLHRNDIFIKGRYIPRTRIGIEDYLLETECRDGTDIDGFLSMYDKFIMENNLNNDTELQADESMKETRINRLMQSDKLLWKQNQRLRYYDIAGEDFTELLDTIDLSRYHNIEISTLKLIREYPEIMRQYDIRDEYELHNLLKKLHVEKQYTTLKFGRMPGLVFGTFDRTAGVKEMMFAFSIMRSFLITMPYAADS